MAPDLQPAPAPVSGQEMQERLVGVAIAIVVVNVVWLVASSASELWPSHGTVWSEFTLLATDGFQRVTLLEHLGATLGRVLFALVVGGFVGGTIGALAGSSSRTGNLLDPLVSFGRAIVPSAVLTISVLYIDLTNELQRLVVVTLPAIWVTSDGVRRATAAWSEQRARAVGDLAWTARTALLITWVVVALVELVGSQTGVTSAIWTGRTFFRYGIVVAMALTSAMMFLILDYLIRFFARLTAAHAGV